AGAVRQFESLTGKVTRELSLFDGRGYGWAQFSPDGRFLATYDEAAELKVWDVARGALLQTQSYRPQQPDHKNLKTIKMVNLNAVAFSPDGRTIALSEDSQELMSRGAEITIRDVANWKPLQTITLQVAVSEKEQMKAMQKASRDAMKAMSKGKSSQPVLTTPDMGANTIFRRALRFTPDGRSLTLMKRDMQQNISPQTVDASYIQGITLEFYDIASGRSISSSNVSPESR